MTVKLVQFLGCWRSAFSQLDRKLNMHFEQKIFVWRMLETDPSHFHFCIFRFEIGLQKKGYRVNHYLSLYVLMWQKKISSLFFFFGKRYALSLDYTKGLGIKCNFVTAISLSLNKDKLLLNLFVTKLHKTCRWHYCFCWWEDHTIESIIDHQEAVASPWWFSHHPFNRDLSGLTCTASCQSYQKKNKWINNRPSRTNK